MPKVFVKTAAPLSSTSSPFPENDFSAGSVYLPVQTLLSWKASSRPYRKKDRSYYTTIIIIITLLILIALLINELLLVGTILAVAFVTFVLAYVPPEEVVYKVSTQGVTIGDHFYLWEILDSFWFSEKEGHEIINIWTHLRFPGQLMLVLGDIPEDKIKEVVARFIPFHEIPPKSLLDKWSEGLQKHFPLENPHKANI